MKGGDGMIFDGFGIFKRRFLNQEHRDACLPILSAKPNQPAASFRYGLRRAKVQQP
jgi:hypothetical protein